MKTLTGTGTLVRLFLRRDRVRTPIWFVVLVAIVALTPASIRELYPTEADLAAFAATAEENPAIIAMAGPAQGLETLGGRIAFELSGQLGIAVALMSVLMVGRHTRAEEESGRTELLRAGVLGEHAPVAAAMIVVAGYNLVLGAGFTVVLLAHGLPAAGSIALGLGMMSVGIVFAAIAAVLAQVTEFTRSVYTMGIAAIGLAFVLRAIGDIGDGTLSWLSPIGWAQGMRPFADERWWVLLLPGVASAVVVAAALVLQDRRDLGAGLVRPRPGRAEATDFLVHPLGLALRLQRTVLLAWAGGVFLIGLAYGSIGVNVEDLIADNPDMRDMMAQAGVDNLVDSFFATTMLMLGLIGGGFAVQSTLKLRGEETAGRIESLLTTGLPRWRWAASHLLVVLGGSVLVMAVGGLGTGLAHGLRTGDEVEVVRLTASGLAHVPALWVLAGFATLLFGALPRLAGFAWAALALAFVVGMLAELLQLPGWTRDLSPFSHVPQVPARDFAVLPELALTALAAVLVLAGLAAFRRRDIG